MCKPPAAPFDLKPGPNGTLVCKVQVPTYFGQKKSYLTFTQHSPDRYTVTGFDLADLASSGVSIERRTHQEKVMEHDTAAVYTLGEADQWIAYSFRSNSYYGVLAIGATAEEAYANMFRRSAN